jgi:hypothetical protein
MAIEKGYKTNFETLQRAFANGDAALVETTRKGTDEKVVLICAIGRDGEEFVISPFAEMCNGDPFELYEAPVKDEG